MSNIRTSGGGGGASTFAELTETPTTIDGYGITDAEYALGNPPGPGYILESDAAGNRSWVLKPVDGADGVSAPELIVKYSQFDVVPGDFSEIYQAGDIYIIVSTDGGATYSTPARILGEQGPVGADGNYFEFIFQNNVNVPTPNPPTGNDPTNGNTGPWYTYPQSGLGYQWMSVATKNSSGIVIGAWSSVTKLTQEPLLVEYSADGATGWSTTFIAGTHFFMRQSTDGGSTWSDAIRVVGETGADGNYFDYRFKRNDGQPATPTVADPVGWSDSPPDGDNALWMTRALKDSSNTLLSTWSTPAKLSTGSVIVEYSATSTGPWDSIFTPGTDVYMRQSTDGGFTWSNSVQIVGETGATGDYTSFIFKRSETGQPTTPTTNDPTVGEGWFDAPPAPISVDDKLWMSKGLFVNSVLSGTWSTPIQLEGENGIKGEDSKVIVMSADSNIFAYNNSSGTPVLESASTITIQLNRQNITASTTWTLTDSLGIERAGILTTVTDTSAVLTEANFSSLANNDFVKITATAAGLSDEITIVKLLSGIDGQGSYVGFLSNESHLVAADSDGTNYDITGNIGTFVVYFGLTDETLNCTYDVVGLASKNGLTISIGATTGIYTLSGAAWTSNTESFTLRATTPGSTTIEKVFTIAKSIAGQDGAPGGSGPAGSDGNVQKFYYWEGTTASIDNNAALVPLNGGIAWLSAPPASPSQPVWLTSGVTTADGTILVENWTSPVQLNVDYSDSRIANIDQLWAEITGAGKPEDNADVTSQNIAAGFTDQGNYETLNMRVDDADVIDVISVSGRVITRTAGAGWDGHAYSAEFVEGPFSLSFQPLQTNKALMVGVNTDPLTNESYTSIDFQFYFEADGTWQIREYGGNPTGIVRDTTTAYSADDIFAIVSDGTEVRYYQNGAVVHTSDNTPSATAPYYIDSSLYTLDASFKVLTFGAGPSKLVDQYIQDGADRAVLGLTAAGVIQNAVPQSLGGTGLTSNATLLNSAISLSSSGSLQNAGGGTINLGSIAGTLTANQISAGTITSAHIAANTIVAGDIFAGTITAVELAANCIITDKLAADSIVANKIAAGQIQTNHMVAGSIDADRLSANTITAAQIAAGTITANEIAANTITAAQIAAGTITANEISAGSISSDRLAANQLSAIAANLGTVTGGTFQTATTGTRAVISSDTDNIITVYNSSNVPTFYVNGSGDLIFAGKLGANSINDIGYFSQNVLESLNPELQANDSTGGSVSLTGVAHTALVNIDQTYTLPNGILSGNGNDPTINISFSDSTTHAWNYTPVAPSYTFTLQRSLNGGAYSTVTSWTRTGIATNGYAEAEPGFLFYIPATTSINVNLSYNDTVADGSTARYRLLIRRTTGEYNSPTLIEFVHAETVVSGLWGKTISTAAPVQGTDIPDKNGHEWYVY